MRSSGHRTPDCLVNKPTAQIPKSQLENYFEIYMLFGHLHAILLAGCKLRDDAQHLSRQWSNKMNIASMCVMLQLT